jgi:alkylhydroperoxidase family enzyme
VGRQQGISDEQLAEIATFEWSKLFSEFDRIVLRYAEAMTRIPADVSDKTFAELGRHLSQPQVVELTAMFAWENFRARFNRALQIESGGFCELPPDHPVRRAVAEFQR